MAIKISTGGNRTKTVVSAKAAPVATVASASAIKIAKLEDNIGNLDKGDDGVLVTGETLVYNAENEKWEAISLADQVSEKVDEKLAGGGLTFALDGGTF